jgi:hypothetical protein
MQPYWSQSQLPPVKSRSSQRLAVQVGGDSSALVEPFGHDPVGSFLYPVARHQQVLHSSCSVDEPSSEDVTRVPLLVEAPPVVSCDIRSGSETSESVSSSEVKAELSTWRW